MYVRVMCIRVYVYVYTYVHMCMDAYVCVDLYFDSKIEVVYD